MIRTHRKHVQSRINMFFSKFRNHFSHNTHHYLEFFKAIRQNIANDTLPTLLTLISEQQSKYDAEKLAQEKKQSDADEISGISTDANPSPFKKLKNDACANEVE